MSDVTRVCRGGTSTNTVGEVTAAADGRDRVPLGVVVVVTVVVRSTPDCSQQSARAPYVLDPCDVGHAHPCLCALRIDTDLPGEPFRDGYRPDMRC